MAENGIPECSYSYTCMHGIQRITSFSGSRIPQKNGKQNTQTNLIHLQYIIDCSITFFFSFVEKKKIDNKVQDVYSMSMQYVSDITSSLAKDVEEQSGP